VQLPSVTWGGKHEGYAVGLGRGAGTRCGWGPGHRGGLCSPGADLNHALRVHIHIHLPHRIIKKAGQRVSHVARVAGCQRVAVPVISQLVRVVPSTGAQTRTAVRGRDPRGRAPPTSFPTPFFSFSSSCPPRRGLGGWAKRESAEPPPTHTRTHTHTHKTAPTLTSESCKRPLACHAAQLAVQTPLSWHHLGTWPKMDVRADWTAGDR
jgi:hypothetical protein